MKDIGGTLRYLDQQIDMKRQQIAVLTLQVAEIENSRKTLLALVEDDQTREQEQHAIRMNGGGHAKPLLIVRKETSEPPPAPVPAFEDPAKKKKRKSPNYGSNWDRYSERRSPLRHKLWKWFQSHPGEQITSTGLTDLLGLQAEAQQVYGALSAMRINGDLVRDGEGRYSLGSGKPAPSTSRRNPTSMRSRVLAFLETQTKPLLSREIQAGMHIETRSLDYKLLGQTLSTLKTSGQIQAIGDFQPYRYVLPR